jgi:hypothetical protein
MFTMALSTDTRSGARILTMRPASRDGLYALASAWQASTGSSVRPFRRPTAPAAAAPDGVVAPSNDPPCWPDGPSAA